MPRRSVVIHSVLEGNHEVEWRDRSVESMTSYYRRRNRPPEFRRNVSQSCFELVCCSRYIVPIVPCDLISRALHHIRWRTTEHRSTCALPSILRNPRDIDTLHRAVDCKWRTQHCTAANRFLRLLQPAGIPKIPQRQQLR